jgi:hypothetical protein
MAENNHHDPQIKLAAESYWNLSDDQRRRFYAEIMNPPEETTKIKDSWQAYSLVDAYKPRPPAEYIAGRMFRLPSLNIVYGAPGVMKSLLMQDLVISVAAGQSWLAPNPKEPSNGGGGFVTKKAHSMWIDFDNGIDLTLNRFEALGTARKLKPEDTQISFYSMPNPWLYATKPESIGELANRIKAACAKLVVIDNLGNVSGDADENSAEMGQVMSQFRQLAEDTRAAIVLIHHQRKGTALPGGRSGDSLRGHSSIEAALDLALIIEREPHSQVISIRATKVRGKDILPFSAMFAYESKSDCDDMAEARFFGVAIEDTESDMAIELAILTILQTNTDLNKTKLKAKVQEELPKIGVNRISAIIDQLAGKGKIQTKPGNVTNEKFYSL